MEFAEGYLTAVQHIARLYEVDAGWTREECIALASGVISAVAALFVAGSAWAAAAAARAAKDSAQVAKDAHEQSVQIWIDQNVQQTVEMVNSLEPTIRIYELEQITVAEEVETSLKHTTESLDESSAQALRELTHRVGSQLEKEWHNLKISLWPPNQVDDMTVERLLNPTTCAAERLRAQTDLLRSKQTHERAIYRLKLLSKRVQRFDPSDPHNRIIPLPENLS